MKVLIADDDAMTRVALRKNLKKWGYEVAEAKDGKAAWEVLLSDDPPRIAILDWMMPGVEGVELCERLNGNPDFPFIYTILLTSKSDKDDIVRALDSGAYDFLSKPVHIAELRSRIAVGVRLVEAEDRLIETNQKIMDSIRYAKRIQDSLLPNAEEINAYLPDSFFLWMPRDIVGGDIYFTEKIENGIIIAVIDCTGHGVPGAFMTMIASSFLRRITKTLICHDPAEILNHLNSIVKTSLQQDTEYAMSDDGMDASVCFINTTEKTLTFAGARLPMHYIQHNEIKTLKGDRQSIGYKRSDLNFCYTNHTIAMEKDMTCYLFTDGFKDQPGQGNQRRRLGSARFREMLVEASDHPIEAQRDILMEKFESYRGDVEQVDDVTVMGFRV